MKASDALTRLYYRIWRLSGRPVIDKYKHEIFLALAKRLDVTQFTIKGMYGDVAGLVDDQYIFRWYAQHGDWAKDINDIFVDFFRDKFGGTYLDIGANIGLTTLPTAVKSGVVCHAFEPEPRNFALLQENISRNVGTANVHLHNMALFSEPTELSFAVDARNFGHHHIHYRTEDARWPVAKSIKVKGERLDAVLGVDTLQKPLAIKMDAEGAEWHVYRGGRAIFAAADLLVTEFWPDAIRNMGGDPIDLIDMIEHDFSSGRVLGSDEQFPGARQSMKELGRQLREVATTSEHVDLLVTRASPAGSVR
jgi:FkbM family methyltransferase